MTSHERAEWVALRREARSGVIGGPRDGAANSDPQSTTFEVECRCPHGATKNEVDVSRFADLVVALTVLSIEHAHAHTCECAEASSADIGRTAVDAWREAFGAGPLGSRP